MRVYDDDAAMLETLAGPNLTTSDVAGAVLSAALNAIRENGGRVGLPLRFRVSQDEEIRAPLPKRKAS